MDANEILTDAASRPMHILGQIRERVTSEVLNLHPAGHDNSVAWLLWHSGREIDVQLRALAGVEEVWTADGFRDRLGLGDLGDGVGYGHTPEQARAVVIADSETLLDYLTETLKALVGYISALSPADLDDIVDERWDPPVNRGVRLISIIDDAVQHIAQAAYVLGAA